MHEIKIAIVDDQNLFRQSLAMLIHSVENFQLVAECAGGQAFIDSLKNTGYEVHIAIIDMDMPGINGIELNDHLQENYPEIKVIVLTVHATETLITRMVNAGIAAYLAKNCDKDELITTIEGVVKNGFYFNNDVKKALQAGAKQRAILSKEVNRLPVKLTRREIQVLNLICKDLNNTEIADKLFLSPRTIEGHRNALMTKIGCQTTAGLALFAIKYQLIPPVI